MSVRKHVVQIDRAKIVMIIHYREMSTSRTEVAREPHRVEARNPGCYWMDYRRGC